MAFSLAAALLTITPGLDTAIVLRTAAVDGPRRAVLAAVGVISGCLVWGAVVALGLGALVQAAPLAFDVIRWVGAAYLVWLGIGLILNPRAHFEVPALDGPASGDDLAWMRRGFLTNLLNPKVGVFYISFLPQFLPQGVSPGPFIFGLATIHAVMGVLWFSVLIGATRPITKILQGATAVRWLDRITGGVFLAFGVRLALERR